MREPLTNDQRPLHFKRLLEGRRTIGSHQEILRLVSSIILVFYLKTDLLSDRCIPVAESSACATRAFPALLSTGRQSVQGVAALDHTGRYGQPEDGTKFGMGYCYSAVSIVQFYEMPQNQNLLIPRISLRYKNV